ncbi:MAG: flagellar motor switch protein FliM [Desulfobacterales bacterium]|nr:flagellar motor switch protein FliM [Desulfobacterales bacterium]
MNDILSQEEVDALLKGVQSGEIDTETARDKILLGVRPYDLTNQERIVRGRMSGFEIINDRFSGFFRNSVSNLIMRFVDISVNNIEIVKFGEFMKRIPFPSSINIFKMEPLKGYSLFVIEAPLVFAFVEFFFGGASAQNVKSEGRAFTAIEQRIIKKVTAIALKDMSLAWNAIAPIAPKHIGSEMNPQFVTIVTPSEIVIKVEIDLEIEDFTGKVFFCIPYSVIEPVKEKLYSGIQSDKFEIDHRWIERLRTMLMDSHVELVAEVGRVEIPFGEMMNLDVGSVITLGKSITDEFVIRVEDIPKFSGVPGYSRGSQAIKITGGLV